jgi:hypothetical protein
MITTINEFKQHLLNENWRVKFETWPEMEDELEHLDQNDLHDHETGITFDNTKKYYKAWVDVKQGKFNDWNFGIYTNNDQILIWGNPNNKQGEVFNVIEGDMNKAREIADHLLKTGNIDLTFDTVSSNDKLVNNIFDVAKKSDNFETVQKKQGNSEDWIGDIVYIKSKLKGDGYHKDDFDEFEIGVDKDDNTVVIHYIPNGNTEEISSIDEFIEFTHA